MAGEAATRTGRARSVRPPRASADVAEVLPCRRPQRTAAPTIRARAGHGTSAEHLRTCGPGTRGRVRRRGRHRRAVRSAVAALVVLGLVRPGDRRARAMRHWRVCPGPRSAAAASSCCSTATSTTISTGDDHDGADEQPRDARSRRRRGRGRAPRWRRPARGRPAVLDRLPAGRRAVDEVPLPVAARRLPQVSTASGSSTPASSGRPASPPRPQPGRGLPRRGPRRHRGRHGRFADADQRLRLHRQLSANRRTLFLVRRLLWMTEPCAEGSCRCRGSPSRLPSTPLEGQIATNRTTPMSRCEPRLNRTRAAVLPSGQLDLEVVGLRSLRPDRAPG